MKNPLHNQRGFFKKIKVFKNLKEAYSAITSKEISAEISLWNFKVAL